MMLSISSLRTLAQAYSDMNHSNMYAVGLALCTFANISSEEMSRDLANEVEKLLGSSNTYIRKKVSSDDLYRASHSVLTWGQAALCALRIIRRVPDLMDHFVNKAKTLLSDRNHGVLLAGITLVAEMCALEDSVRDEFRQVSYQAEANMGAVEGFHVSPT